jgi:hypothetical protein
VTVSAVIPDPRKAKRTPDFIFYVRKGERVNVERASDRDEAEQRRADFIAAGATEV